MSRTDKSSPKKQKESLFLTAGFFCGACEKHVICDKNAVGFSSSSSECELCGSHGSTTVYFTCPVCKKGQSVELSTW